MTEWRGKMRNSEDNGDYYYWYYLPVSKRTVKLWILHGRLVREINFKLSLHQFILQIWASGTNLILQKEETKAFRSPVQISAVFGSIEIRDGILKVCIFRFGLTSGLTVFYTTLLISMHPIQCFLSGLWSHNRCVMEKILLWKLY